MFFPQIFAEKTPKENLRKSLRAKNRLIMNRLRIQSLTTQ
ncbi:MAG: hypothetical protein RIS64_49 [Bacteroidota bacterium]